MDDATAIEFVLCFVFCVCVFCFMFCLFCLIFFLFFSYFNTQQQRFTRVRICPP